MRELNESRKDLRAKNQKQNKIRVSLRALFIIALTIFLVQITGIYGTSLAYLGDFISQGRALVKFGDGWPCTDDYSDFIQSEKMGTGLCVLTKDSLVVYSPTADEILNYSHSMQNPVMSVSDSRAVLYDLNSTTLKVLNANSVVFSQEMSNSIIHADISQSNRVAVTTRSSSYSGEVTVYSYSMDPKITWYCATGYPVYAKLSDNGKKMAVETVQTDNGSFKSTIYLIDINDAKEIYTLTADTYPLDIIFTSSSEYLVVYPDRIVSYRTDSSDEKASFSLDGGYLRSITKKNGYIAVSYGSQVFTDKTKVTLLSSKLAEKFTTEVDDNIKSLSVSQSRVFALGDETVYEYDYEGIEKSATPVYSYSKKLVNYNGTKLITSVDIENIKKTKTS